MERRLIEVAFPFREVSRESKREKNVRQGHISTLHIWWARRPLAASRATAFAALIPDPSARGIKSDGHIPRAKDEGERAKLRELVAQLAPWVVVSQASQANQELLERARKLIQEAFGGRAPKILDCFAGGGAIPLEALRLGCETHALDYNPVAVLLLKAVLEYPQKFGKPIRRPAQTKAGARHALPLHDVQEEVNPLLEAVLGWGHWVLEEARKELEQFYPKDADGAIPVGYIWARTIPCQNPACGAEIPLMRQTWLCRKPKKKVALRFIPVRPNGGTQNVASGLRAQCSSAPFVGFELVEGTAIDFDPGEGTVSRARVRCPVCGAMIDDKTTRRLFREGKTGQRLVAVVLHSPSPLGGTGFQPVRGRRGKSYRLATERDLESYRAAEAALEEKRQALWAEWGMDPVPDEPTPVGGGSGAERAFSVHKYGMTHWGDLFNARQKLSLITFADKVRQAYILMKQQGSTGFQPVDQTEAQARMPVPPEEFAKAVTTYLALVFNRIADKNASIVVWDTTRDMPSHVFARQALPMVWDYAETNLLSGSTGDWRSALAWVLGVIEHCSQIPSCTGWKPVPLETSMSRPEASPDSVVSKGSATSLPFPDDYFDAVFTDPPYYDNVPYSDLSDFFYVWLKRTVGDLYPELFATSLSPKSQEMVADASKAGSMAQATERFEVMLTQAFREIYRVLKPDGIAVIVFAHKTTEAWEAIINALLEADLYMTASWPIHTEMAARLRAQESAALASSIYMVCRKRSVGADGRPPIGDYGKVREEIRRRVEEALLEFWNQGIVGADFFMVAIGPAVEAFGHYSRVEKLSGETVSVRELLALAHEVATEFVLRRILGLWNNRSGHYSTGRGLGAGQDVSLPAGVDAVTQFYLLWRWSYGRDLVPFDEARKLAQARGVDLEALARAGRGAPALLKKSGEYVRLLGPKDRDFGAMRRATPGRTGETSALLDKLHQACLLWEQGKQELEELLHGTSEAFWLVAQALADVLPEGAKERQLLHGLLLAQRKTETEGPSLFDGL